MSGWSLNSHLPITKNFTANISIHKYNKLTQYWAQTPTQVNLKFCCSKFSSLSLPLPKTSLGLFIFRNVQNQGQLAMQTKLGVGSYFNLNCSAQPSEWDHPSAQNTLRSPGLSLAAAQPYAAAHKGGQNGSLSSFQHPRYR